MLGSIIGDIVGSPYEFNNIRNTDFELFGRNCDFTDDTICTVAVADAILRKTDFAQSLQKWCRRYPNPKGAYGMSFSRWIHEENPRPYGSYGNGAAMRVSPCGWAFPDDATTIREAMKSAKCSHSHVEGLIGAATVALAIFRLRTIDNCTFDSEPIRSLFDTAYGENPAITAPGVFDESCQGCVPLAYRICLKADSFEDAIRLAVAYGGDSDTLGAIVGGMAEARWSIPEDIRRKGMSYLPDDIREVVINFEERFGHN